MPSLHHNISLFCLMMSYTLLIVPTLYPIIHHQGPVEINILYFVITMYYFAILAFFWTVTIYYFVITISSCAKRFISFIPSLYTIIVSFETSYLPIVPLMWKLYHHNVLCYHPSTFLHHHSGIFCHHCAILRYNITVFCLHCVLLNLYSTLTFYQKL